MKEGQGCLHNGPLMRRLRAGRTDSTEILLKHLDRPLQPGVRPVKLSYDGPCNYEREEGPKTKGNASDDTGPGDLKHGSSENSEDRKGREQSHAGGWAAPRARVRHPKKNKIDRPKENAKVEQRKLRPITVKLIEDHANEDQG